ncbi:MAG: DUF4860 domain-containing protein [Oscillospiraceae bacterium]
MSENPSVFRRMLVPILCAVFFFFAMALAIMSSSIYERTAKESDTNYDHRTALSYLANQIRRGDRADAITIGGFDGCEAIAISDDDGYITYIYCLDGQLCELFTESGSGLLPSDGTKLLPLDSLKITLETGNITLNADGNTLTLHPECGVLEVPEL